MENLNAEQVKKALECCTSYCDKDNCPYKTHDIPIACMTMRMVDALALINLQEQRIKELTEENKKLTINMNAYGLTAKRLGEENERLMGEKESIAEDFRNEVLNYKYAYDNGRADTVRKMQERLKKYYHHLSGKTLPASVEYHIDQIANEMLKEDE